MTPAPRAVAVTTDAAHKGRHVRAMLPLRAGEVAGVLPVTAVVDQPGQHTLQLDETRHAQGLGDFVWLNHACDPSVFVDTSALNVVVVRDLAVGDELTFFYPATEWTLAVPFDCHCGAARCLGRVTGARDLPPETLRDRRLNAHVQRLLGW